MNYLDKFRNFKKKVKEKNPFVTKGKSKPIIELNQEIIDDLIQYYETDDDINYNQKLVNLLRNIKERLTRKVYVSGSVNLRTAPYKIVLVNRNSLDGNDYNGQDYVILDDTPTTEIKEFDDKLIKELTKLGFHTREYDGDFKSAEERKLEVKWKIIYII